MNIRKDLAVLCKMKKIMRYLFSICLFLLCITSIFYCFVCQEKETVIKSFLSHSDGSCMVVGRYRGIIEGWRYSFWSFDDKGNSRQYYLGHEENKWDFNLLELENKKVAVIRDGDFFAEFDVQKGTLYNFFRQCEVRDEEIASHWFYVKK